jgi:proliferating cell nuclear antigen
LFKAEIKADTLKGIVNVISTLVDEVKFMIDTDGIGMKAVDPAHVAMIEVEVGKGAFESYSAERTDIGIDLDKVKEVLKLASPGDIISMEQDESHGRIVFRVGNITRRMNLVDTSSMSDPKVPQLWVQAKVDIVVSELQKGIKAAETISDHIALSADAGSFELSSEGDTDAANLRLEKNKLIGIEAKSKVCSRFPLDYFSNLVKAVPADTNVRIELDNDYPVKIAFDLAGGNGTVRYLLAPRIESD